LAQNAAAQQPAVAGPDARLVLLGTRGGPGVDLSRSESASAVVVDGVPYVVDCGYGTMRALVAAGIGYVRVNTLFFTHLHDDHTADLAALLAHQWTGSKTTQTHIYGPHATAAMVAAAIEFSRANVEIRMVDEGRTVPPEALFFGHDLQVEAEPVRVFADDRVVVTAVTNTHFPERATARMLHRSLGYRFETSTRSPAHCPGCRLACASTSFLLNCPAQAGAAHSRATCRHFDKNDRPWRWSCDSISSTTHSTWRG
jgi:hypothetical protein